MERANDWPLEPIPPEKPARSENLRRAPEALDRQLEHRKEFFEALERLEKLARR
jgi:hypothetical protein